MVLGLFTFTPVIVSLVYVSVNKVNNPTFFNLCQISRILCLADNAFVEGLIERFVQHIAQRLESADKLSSIFRNVVLITHIHLKAKLISLLIVTKLFMHQIADLRSILIKNGYDSLCKYHQIRLNQILTKCNIDSIKCIIKLLHITAHLTKILRPTGLHYFELLIDQVTETLEHHTIFARLPVTDEVYQIGIERLLI